MQDSEAEPRLVLSPKKAARALDVSEDTIGRLVEAGELESVRISARRRGITLRSLRKLVESPAP
jgi:excisionase family DNA binding protein